MKNIEKNCLQGLKRQNKLFANIICIKKNSLHRSQRNFFFNFFNEDERRLALIVCSPKYNNTQ